MPQSVHSPQKGGRRSVQREPTDEYEDYDDQYVDSPTQSNPVGRIEDLHVDDELPDTTMLDSVILPAIASVSGRFALLISILYCRTAIPSSVNTRGTNSTQRTPTGVYRR